MEVEVEVEGERGAAWEEAQWEVAFTCHGKVAIVAAAPPAGRPRLWRVWGER